MPEELNYPSEVVSDSDKLEFCYKALEQLRFKHNCLGALFQMGNMTNAEFNNYLLTCYANEPDYIKAIKKNIEGKTPISKIDFDDYVRNEHDQKELKIAREIGRLKNILSKSNKFEVDLDSI